MKLFYSPASPYVRKVLVLAHEAGIADNIELLDSHANPINRDGRIVARNPTGKVPTMVLDDDSAIYDSHVICEYVDAQHGSTPFFPKQAPRRWQTLTLHALADGLLDAALLARYEQVLRPEQLQWPDWLNGQLDKIRSSVAALEGTWLPHLQSSVDIGVIACGCALGYLDFRFPDLDWRTEHPGVSRWYQDFAKRPSMQATWPKG